MKPYKTKPMLMERIWGGQRLKEYYKDIEDRSIGESWETDIEDRSLPALIKFIDANDILSVQVHPDDYYANKLEDQFNGKNEMWVILDCEEDSQIVYGFKKPLRKSELEEAVNKNTLIEMLNFVNVKKGDCIFIPAGTVHTLGKGILAYEVQQPSDITYRLYDWDRIDIKGNKRELHLEKALEVINYSNKLPAITNIYKAMEDEKENIISISKNSYFDCNFISLRKNESLMFEKNKEIIVSILWGKAYLYIREQCFSLSKGDTWIIPWDCTDDVYIQGLTSIEFIETSKNISTKLHKS